ncbi:hypothetical protein ABZ208_30900 [Streptomyces sp. NPDC006208]
MLTCIDHLGLCTEEISDIGEQPDNHFRAFTHVSFIGSAFGLDHTLG